MNAHSLARGTKFFLPAALLLLFASSAFSQTIPLFGPKVFVKEKGAPITYTNRFVIPPGTGNFRLVVKNGVSDAGEVKNVSIVLNGTEIMASSDLRVAPMAMKQVTLRQENEIQVTLKGQGGNAIFLQLDGDLVAPDPMEPPMPMPPMPPMPN